MSFASVILHVRDEDLPGDNRDRGPKIVGLACGFLAASMVVGLLRLGLRLKRRLFSWDDSCIVVALLFSTLQTLAACMSASWGYGKPVATLSKHQLSRAIFWFYLAQIGYKGAIWPSKISILLLYNRVFGDSTQRVTSFGIRLRISLVVLITFGGTFFIVSEIVTIFTCVPVQRYWDRTIPGKCEVNTLAWWFTQSVMNTISDIFILILPMPLIKDLQIPQRQKISLMLVFTLGIFITICTIVRMTTFKTGARGADTTYDGAITLSWSIIETNIAIICACLPLLRPLISRLVPGFNKTRSGRSKENKPSTPNSGDSAGQNSYSLKSRCRGFGRLHRGRGEVHDGHNNWHNNNGTGGVGIAGGGGDKGGRRMREFGLESWDWKDATTITATNMTTHRSGSDDSQAGIVRPSEVGKSQLHQHQSSQRDRQGGGGGGTRNAYGGVATPGDLGGIVKQTDVEITREEASECGSVNTMSYPITTSAYAGAGNPPSIPLGGASRDISGGSGGGGGGGGGSARGSGGLAFSFDLEKGSRSDSPA